MTDILPDCRAMNPAKVVRMGGLNWTPIFCANCGKDGGLIPAENYDFSFYICAPCSEKYPVIEGTYVEPDHVFWEKVAQTQMEKYGRMLEPHELDEVVKDENSTLAKLAKDRPLYGNVRMT